jgi:cytochrome c oxidase assembly factor CtaG
MRALIAFILFVVWIGPAAAHGNEPHGAAMPWTFDPWVITPIVLIGLFYAAGSVRLRLRSRRHTHGVGSSLLFWSGWVMLLLALVSPLHFLGEHLFTFHMIEHEIVMAVSAPLMVLARPIGILLWGLPRRVRCQAALMMNSKPVRKLWEFVVRGSSATILHGLAIWIWHAPALFDATVTNIGLHRLQHLSFFLTAILFWWSIVWHSDRGLAAWHLFVTMLHTSVLGALIALAPNVAYLDQTSMAQAWGLTPLEDQQLAGLLMWVPGGIIYAGAALWMLALWIKGAGQGEVNASHIRAL